MLAAPFPQSSCLHISQTPFPAAVAPAAFSVRTILRRCISQQQAITSNLPTFFATTCTYHCPRPISEWLEGFTQAQDMIASLVAMLQDKTLTDDAKRQSAHALAMLAAEDGPCDAVWSAGAADMHFQRFFALKWVGNIEDCFLIGLYILFELDSGTM